FLSPRSLLLLSFAAPLLSGAVAACGEGGRWDDARQAFTAGHEPPASNPVRGVAERGVAERGVAERGVAERGVAVRGVAERGVAERGVAERGVAERGVAERGVAVRGVAERGVAERGVAERGVAVRGVAVRGVAERGVAERGVAFLSPRSLLLLYFAAPLLSGAVAACGEGGRSLSQRPFHPYRFCFLVPGQREHELQGAVEAATGKGIAERGVAERGVAERGVAERGVAERGVAVRGVAERGVAVRGVAVRGVAERGVAVRGVAERDLPYSHFLSMSHSPLPSMAVSLSARQHNSSVTEMEP
ncbi:unnamed protein product, partial [Closterium sp. NIES-53]